MRCTSRTGGFSLVELSIVLVILGLLVGGILGGQSLIRAAELRAVTTEFEQWRVALNSFKMKYNDMPGDMRNATRFFGDAGVCTAVMAQTHLEPLAGGTCNGNGNGIVFSADSDRYERFLFWQQLQLAGLISGTYSGVRGAGGTDHHVTGGNTPASKLSGAAWATAFRGGSAAQFDLTYTNALVMSAESPNAAPVNAVFKPEEAWGIDAKLDDGRPAQGIIVVRRFADACTDAEAATDFDANYNLSESGTLCSLLFNRVY